MIQLTDNIYAVEVPDEVIEISVYQFKHRDRSIPYWHINWNYPKEHPYTSGGLCLFYKNFGGKKYYPNNLQFLFTTKEATEEECVKVIDYIVSPVLKGYRDYLAIKDVDIIEAIVDTPDESLNSLLRSKGLNTENNYAIIQKYI